MMQNRKPNRLQNYDYAQNGMYFVTICTKDHEELLGEIKNGEMELNDAGKIVDNAWKELPDHYANINLGTYSIMPNHFHCILEILPNVGVGFKPAQNFESVQLYKRTGLKPVPTKKHSLSEIIRGFKTFSARFINQHDQTPGRTIWQRSYYDHIIRNEISLNKIREYIQNNPKIWKRDRNNTENILM